MASVDMENPASKNVCLRRKIVAKKVRQILLVSMLLGAAIVIPSNTTADPPFEYDVKVDSDPGGSMQETPSIVVDPSGVYVAWEDNRNGHSDIFFAKSVDGGLTWTSPDVLINTDGVCRIKGILG